MTLEIASELIDAWNSGYCVSPAERATLDRLRMDWAAATDNEREIFKAEIQPRPGVWRRFFSCLPILSVLKFYPGSG